MKRKQMMISFGAYDDDVYNYLQKNKNASALIRMLVRSHMTQNPIKDNANIVQRKENNQVLSNNAEQETNNNLGFDYSRCSSGDDNKNNRKKIQELDL